MVKTRSLERLRKLSENQDKNKSEKEAARDAKSEKRNPSDASPHSRKIQEMVTTRSAERLRKLRENQDKNKCEKEAAREDDRKDKDAAVTAENATSGRPELLLNVPEMKGSDPPVQSKSKKRNPSDASPHSRKTQEMVTTRSAERLRKLRENQDKNKCEKEAAREDDRKDADIIVISDDTTSECKKSLFGVPEVKESDPPVEVMENIPDALSHSYETLDESLPEIRRLTYYVKSRSFGDEESDGVPSSCVAQLEGKNVLRGLQRLVESGIAHSPLPPHLWELPIDGKTTFQLEV